MGKSKNCDTSGERKYTSRNDRREKGFSYNNFIFKLKYGFNIKLFVLSNRQVSLF